MDLVLEEKVVTMGVYQIRNKINGKVYIGSSVNVPSRWESHRRELRRGVHKNQYLQNAWIKYGEKKFVFSLIEEVTDVEELLLREQFWLDTIQPYLPRIGYNIYANADSPPPLLLTHEGRTQPLDAWAKEYRIKRATLWRRLYDLGYSMEEALNTKNHAKSGLKPQGERALTRAEIAARAYAKRKNNIAFRSKNAERSKKWYEANKNTPEFRGKIDKEKVRIKNKAYYEKMKDDPEFKRRNYERVKQWRAKKKARASE